MHKQVIVKLNIPVDEKIAPLVLALNDFPNLLSGTSCQEDKNGDSNVAFDIEGASSVDLLLFLEKLSAEIGKLNGDLHVSLTLEWFAGGESPLAWVKIPPNQSDLLATVLQSIAKNWG